MAGDWIKMRSNLWDDPRIGALADATETSEAAVIGGLYWLWATADQHTEDGHMPNLTLRQIDRKTGIEGFAATLVQIGWIEECADGVTLCHFDEHNGASAKKRAVTARRVANHRESHAVTPSALPKEDKDVTGALAREREEKEEEEEINTPAIAGSAPSVPATGYQVPDCPQEAIRTLYHDTLPSLRRMEVWNAGRQAALRARWREVCAAERYDRDQGLEWFRDFFQLVSRSRFLMGRAPPKPGSGKPFSADLEWLMKAANFAKVVEGRYDE
jgi:hypothetical protein